MEGEEHERSVGIWNRNLLFTRVPFNLQVLQDANPQGIRVGAQSVYFETKGAFTAAVSAPMLKSVGAELVLVGHSERRSVFGESNADINRSLKQVLAHDMVPVLCVGETLQEYESGNECSYVMKRTGGEGLTYYHCCVSATGLNKEVISAQLSEGLVGITAEQAAGIVVAYEPVSR